MRLAETAEIEMSSLHCPHCGCGQTKEAVDALVFTGGISGKDCEVCGDYFTVGEPVKVGFGASQNKE